MTTRDNNLRRQSRNIHQKGAYVYATVEDVILGLATVRLTGGGARLTNLPVVGGAVYNGQRVAIDYSAGVPPVVRPISEEQQPTVGLGLPEGPEVNVYKRRDHSCRLILTEEETVTKDQWLTVPWDEAEYQTDTFWTSGANITLPLDGVYIFLADVAWSESHDHWAQIHEYGTGVKPLESSYIYEPLRIEFYSVDAGASFGHNTDFPVESVPSVNKMQQAMATHYGSADEVVQMKVYFQSQLDTMNLVNIYEANKQLATRLTIQWMGARE